MDERLKDLEEEVAALDAAVTRQDRRIAALEGGITEPPMVANDDTEAVETIDPAPEAESINHEGVLKLSAFEDTMIAVLIN